MECAMRVNDLLLRCFAVREGDQWVAMCVDLSLAAQADTLDEAKAKLKEQVGHYLADALIGPDREHAAYLLKRRAPVRIWVAYWMTYLKALFSHHKERLRAMTFSEAVPLSPRAC